MKLSVVCSRFPYPIEKGDKLRIYHQIKTLSQKHEIQLIAFTFRQLTDSERNELLKYCTEIHILQLQKWKQWLHIGYRFFSSLPYQVLYFYNPFLKRKVHSKIMQFNPDLIYCQLIRAAEYVKALPIPKVLDYMDAFSLGYMRRTEEMSGLKKYFYNEEVKRLKSYERSIFFEFDRHTIISKQDREAIDVAGNSSITIVKNGVDAIYFQSTTEKKHPANLLFVGNMGYEPNHIAAKYLLEEIWPDIKDIENLNLTIAGARPSDELQSYNSDRVHITGWIDDIRKAYENGTLFIAPLFTGSGLQNKILEALAMEIPVITTSMVNNSIKADSDTVLTADSAQEFIVAIRNLLNDRERITEMSKNGRKFIKENFSWDATTQKLEALLVGQKTKRR